jgi:hypothetical protein
VRFRRPRQARRPGRPRRQRQIPQVRQVQHHETPRADAVQIAHTRGDVAHHRLRLRRAEQIVVGADPDYVERGRRRGAAEGGGEQLHLGAQARRRRSARPLLPVPRRGAAEGEVDAAGLRHPVGDD